MKSKATLYSGTVRRLIEYSFGVQRAFLYRQNMERLDYINEYCTIVMRGPRQSGSSQAVSDLARLYDAWIVAPTMAIAKQNYKDWGKVCSIRSLDRTRGSATSVVICDSVAELKNSDIELLHELAAGRRVFALVYMGCLPRT